MSTALEQMQDKARLIGTHALLRAEDGLLFGVRINNVNRTYGRWRYLVSPVDGLGEKWVGEERLNLADGPAQ